VSVGYAITFDGAVSTTAVPELIVQTVDRELLGEVRDDYVVVPGFAGSVLFPELDGDRTIDMECQIVAASGTARRAAVRALAKWVRKTERKRLIIDQEPDRFWMAKLEDNASVTERITRGFFTLTWRTGPYAMSLATSEVSATRSSGVALTADAVSASDVEVEPVIEIVANTPNPAGFTITIGGTDLVYGASVLAADELTISCVTQTVVTGLWADEELDTGSFDGASLSMSSVSGAFGVLNGDGGNSVVVTGIDADVRIVWRERYL